MPAKEQPTPQDAITASQTLLDGLAHAADVLVRQAYQDLAQGPGHLRHNDQFGTQPSRSSDGGAADHNGGSRATAITTNRHAARLVFQSVSKPNADYECPLVE
jgi:hypothetical protein